MARNRTTTTDTAAEGAPTSDNATAATEAKKPTARRLYLVSEQPTGDAAEGAPGKPVALVEASSAAQAVDFHTGAHKFTAKYAEQTDLFAAAKAGLEVQLAPVKDAQ